MRQRGAHQSVPSTSARLPRQGPARHLPAAPSNFYSRLWLCCIVRPHAFVVLVKRLLTKQLTRWKRHQDLTTPVLPFPPFPLPFCSFLCLSHTHTDASCDPVSGPRGEDPDGLRFPAERHVSPPRMTSANDNKTGETTTGARERSA